MKKFKQYFEESVNLSPMEELSNSVIEGLGDYAAYEMNMRPPESLDKGTESIGEEVEDYLRRLGLTDTDAGWYEKRQEIYQVLWDDNAYANKEMLSSMFDKEEREEQNIINQRCNAMLLASMNNMSYEEYVEQNGGEVLSKNMEDPLYQTSQEFRKRLQGDKDEEI